MVISMKSEDVWRARCVPDLQYLRHGFVCDRVIAHDGTFLFGNDRIDVAGLPFSRQIDQHGLLEMDVRLLADREKLDSGAGILAGMVRYLFGPESLYVAETDGFNRAELLRTLIAVRQTTSRTFHNRVYLRGCFPLEPQGVYKVAVFPIMSPVHYGLIPAEKLE